MAEVDNGIFISYRREDTRWFATLLTSRLRSAFPVLDTFLDVDSIEPGLPFPETLERTLGSCRLQFVLIGPRWLKAQDEAGRRRLDQPGDWVRQEIEWALERGVRVVPVFVEFSKALLPDQLPEKIGSLAQNHAIKIEYEDHDRGLDQIQGLVRSLFGEQLTASGPGESQSRQPVPQVTAHSALSFFELDSNDTETLSIVAEAQLDAGRFELARDLFRLVLARKAGEFGTDDVDVARARYQVGRSCLHLADLTVAVDTLAGMLPIVERHRDSSYPLYLRTQAALARAHLELEEVENARSVLPRETLGILFRDQSFAAVEAWMSHLQNDFARRDRMISKLEHEHALHPPTLEFGRSTAHLIRTFSMTDGRPTMMWGRRKLLMGDLHGLLGRHWDELNGAAVEAGLHISHLKTTTGQWICYAQSEDRYGPDHSPDVVVKGSCTLVHLSRESVDAAASASLLEGHNRGVTPTRFVTVSGEVGDIPLGSALKDQFY